MSSWFYKLRRKRSCESNIGAFVSKTPAAARHQNQKPPPPSPATPPWSPNRASYYFPTRARAAALSSPNKKQQQQQTGNPKLRDTRFPRSPLQPGGGDIVFDVVARRDDDVFGAPSPRPVQHHHQLKLRPIITSRAHVDDEASFSSSDSGGGGAKWPTATTTTRMMRRRLRAPSGDGNRTTAKGKPAEETCSSQGRRLRDGGGGKLRWVYESVVVVKESAEPEEDFLASMAEMIAAHGGVRSPRGMEDLLACYLALNDAEHHRAIVAAFRRAWLDSVAPPPTPMIRERCRLHVRCL
ncbi:hypothetical protein QOZ80_7BG0612940 [Eleusine coracana subsp. coracana]|uniref:Transcription repressor n=1 Tax=Eleusine coracana subsp. coracana TaxID=191504 RepID=A0AAV9FVL8_ELECO|nr:hypothetical protein QOZ80_UnG0728170 [Eleusine coracana subsp. coracana]KAK3126029.1 hypothetical protein QOZ80_7BG0612940 [Eleusine coracana subsp. coracana]